MRKILILGAGRSSTALIRYLVTHATHEQWRITVADKDPGQARLLTQDAGGVATCVSIDATNAQERAALVAAHDLVISMLPAHMHLEVVKDCLHTRRHAITPSYVSDDLRAMDADVRAAGLIMLNEMGLDPGIDHMSAMRIIDRIKGMGGTVTAFESHTGGLVAPACDDNLWGYKFSWNPRNVVLAGQGGAARYIRDGRLNYLPYHRLFRVTEEIEVHGHGRFDAYANRDSLKYRHLYGLDGIPTLLRGTLRKTGFCEAWDVLVQLGCTDDSYTMELPATALWREYLTAFLPGVPPDAAREGLTSQLGLEPGGGVMARIDELGLFSTDVIGVEGLSPAATLQHLLEQKWKLGPKDRDMVVMWHRFRYTMPDAKHELLASLVVEGSDPVDTAMARTVGLPVAMAAKLVLNGGITERGVLLPLTPAIYDPILDELAADGIVFDERAS